MKEHKDKIYTLQDIVDRWNSFIAQKPKEWTTSTDIARFVQQEIEKARVVAYDEGEKRMKGKMEEFAKQEQIKMLEEIRCFCEDYWDKYGERPCMGSYLDQKLSELKGVS